MDSRAAAGGDGGWQLWFVMLSGWPVFLTLVALGVAGGIGLSVLFTKMGSRSVLQNALLAVVSIFLLAAALLGVISVLSRDALN